MGSDHYELAIDSSDNVWVTRYGGNCVVKVASNGDLLGTYSVGSGPFGVAVDKSGNVWVANSGGTVTRLNLNGELIGTYTAGSNHYGISVDPSGNAWVANPGDGTVTKLDPSGNIIGTYPAGSAPLEIAFDSYGNAWVTNSNSNGTVTELSPDGAKLGTYPVGKAPWFVAVDSSDNIWVTNRAGGTVTKLTHPVVAPTITTTSLPGGTLGVAYCQSVSAATYDSVTWSVYGGSLPDGLTLASNTGTISGTPTKCDTFNFTAKATNTAGSDTQDLNIAISPAPPSGSAPVITSLLLEEGTVGKAYNQTITATGDTPVTWSIDSGSLPAGLTLDPNTGAVSGIPTESGIFKPAVKATNAAGNDTQTVGIFINQAAPSGTAPTITTNSLPGGKVDTAYSQSVWATGDAPFTWSISGGSLPGGLSLSTGGTIFGTPTVSGTFNFTVMAANTMGDNTCALSIVIGAKSSSGSFSDNVGGNNNPSTPAASTYTAVVKGGTAGSNETLPITVNQSTGSAALNISPQQREVITGGGNAVITVPSIPEVTAYILDIPADYLTIPDGKGTLTFNTGTGSVTLPANMLADVAGTNGKKANVSIGQGDKSNLPPDIKAAIGDKPMVQITLMLDGKQTAWSNPDAPVSISIPYTPTADELLNPENIIVWYIDGSGNAVFVPNGHYDAASGAVNFTTTHLSNYAVGYNKISFKDVDASAWYNKPVGFIAARGITTGTGSGNYSPAAEFTRGEFLVMMMKAYEIAPDADLKDNFSDAGDTFYSKYLSAAKRLSISGGIGNNMFAPDKEITRQDMFTLLYNALKVIGKLPQDDAGKSISSFSDAGQVAPWAKEAMTWFVKSGTIGGSGGKLDPGNTTTRAQMAQVLYSLLNK